MGSNQKYAVLTGDIIESSKLNAEQLAAARKALEDIVADFKALYPRAIIGEPAFFRGDGWQLLLARPRYSLRLLLFIASGLKMRRVNNSRIGAAAGPVKTINYDNISLSNGAAFTESGRVLNAIENIKIKKDKPLWRLSDKNIYRVLTFAALTAVADNWTPAIAGSIYGALKGLNQHEIASETGGSRQNTAKQLRRGKWSLIAEILAAEEKQPAEVAFVKSNRQRLHL
ncbi:MAG: hypothetical protein PHH77_03825 [Victivallaceae bacterium]|nr:hypothetical protein [Victivallaceae bacterium]